MIETAEKTRGIALRLSDAAEILGISARTLREWIQLGRIGSLKYFDGSRRVTEDEICRVMDASYIPAKTETRRKRSASAA